MKREQCVAICFQIARVHILNKKLLYRVSVMEIHVVI